MSQIRATVEKELLAPLISLGPNVPNMLQEFASGLLIHCQCLGVIVEGKRLRKIERDKLNPFSNNLWEIVSLTVTVECCWRFMESYRKCGPQPQACSQTVSAPCNRTGRQTKH